MSTAQMSGLLQHLHAAFDRDGAGVTDGELLNRFLRHRDDAAVTLLVRRHSSMVWGVCRRLLHSHHDAEDAFQATFLVLVRKAASVVPREMVANWLYGVAHQTAVRIRATAAKRGVRERQGMDIPDPAQDETRADDLLPLLDQELSCLPERFRVLLVLSDLEGKTRKEVAQQLGCPEGTVASRLMRARTMLAKRLARQGFAVSEASVACVLSQGVASASAPASVVTSTIKAVSLSATGQAVSCGLTSAKVVALTEEVVKAMFVSKIKSLMSVMLVGGMVLGGVGTGVGLSTGGAAVAQSEARPRVALVPAAQAEQPTKPTATPKTEIEERLQQLRAQLQELEVRKAAEDRLQQLMKQLRELEAKKALDAKNPAPPANPQANPPLGGGFRPGPGTPWQAQVLPGQPAGDPAFAALQGLLKSSDPKVAALAKGLLTLLPKPATPAGGSNPFAGGAWGGKPGEAAPVEPRLNRLAQIPNNPWGTPAGGLTRTPATTVGDISSLKLSADGKTAAVVSADGTITVYDVASGKEQMKFAGKK